MNAFVPAQAIHPGEFLADELEARGWAQEDLAEITGISRRQIVNLLQKKSGITPDTAMKFSEAFNQEPKIWMHYQVTYELAMEAQKERDVRRKAFIFEKVPVRELRRRQWISATDKVDVLEAEVCRFLKIQSIGEEPDVRVAARKSTSYDLDTAAQIAWYRRCWQLAELAPASTYNSSQFEDGIAELLKLAACPEDARRVPRLLQDMGIRFVINQHLSGTKIDAVAFWLDQKSPVIAVSLRHGRIDNFWFNILHEAVHIKYGHNAIIDVDTDDRTEGDSTDMEQIANREAAEYLIPRAALDGFIARVGGYFYQARVIEFARSQEVDPGIVVGQLHHHPNGLQQRQLRKLLVPIRDYVIGQAVTDGWGDSPHLEDN